MCRCVMSDTTLLVVLLLFRVYFFFIILNVSVYHVYYEVVLCSVRHDTPNRIIAILCVFFQNFQCTRVVLDATLLPVSLQFHVFF